MSLISKALDSVDNAEVLLKIKGVIALFIQTMDVREPYCMFLSPANQGKDLGLPGICSGQLFA
jgi:hypothetical protein